MTEAEAAKAPEGMQMKDLNQMPGYKFAIVVSAFDCTGCGSCVNVCPDKVQAITMTGFEAHEDEQKYFDYAVSLEDKKMLSRNSNLTLLRDLSSVSHYLSSPELVVDVVRHLTLS